MSLATGARLGAYEIVGSIGAGGMGEVYRARDPRLGRDVAIKVLPASFAQDAGRVRRFEKEARAAGALNHPNLVTVFDVGSHDGSPFLVMELLEGATLKEVLAKHPLAVAKAVDYAVQMAVGLSAAHEGGTVHRDLKPANVFVTRDGRVKILDFGLAKLSQPLVGESGDSEAVTASRGTESGAILGTAGYMSPEQVAGQAADARSDIFSFGAVLYEMVSGRRAFQGPTTVDTLSAILNQDPPELARVNGPVPPALERIVRHCLEKEPSRRFRSAHDLAFALEALSGSGTRPGMDTGTVAPVRRWTPAVAGTLLVAGLALAAGSYLAGSRGERPLPSFQRLTFRRGIIGGARFAPDGKTVVYSAEWDGTRPEVFTTGPESPESRALGLAGYRLWAVSSTGELAIEQRAEGVLAQVPLGGGAPRALLEIITAADWSPDGKSLAIVRDWDRLEFPPGNTLYQSRSKRWIYFPRVSPTGDRLAFIESDNSYNASVMVVDLQGKPMVTTRRWKVAEGLAWSPKGDEVWFSASEVGEALTLHAVDLSGRVRQVAGIPGRVVLRDISREGRLLLTRETIWIQIAGVFPGSTQERDLSWLDAPQVADISADGQTLLFTESGEGGGRTSLVYLRKTDGSPAVRLGEGTALSLSPDGKWAAVQPPNTGGPQVVLLPTRAGEARQLAMEPLTERGGVSWFPDSKRLVVCGTEPGHKARCYVVDAETGQTRPLTPEGVRGFGLGGGNAPVSPDGRSLLVWDARDPSVEPAPVAVYSIEAGELQPLRGWTKGGSPKWSADGRAILAHTGLRLGGAPTSFEFEWPPATWLLRFDLAKGVTETLGKLTIADRVGAVNRPTPVLTPDGRYYAYQQSRLLGDLYLVDGLH
jgi:Tol biopolymer transport system component